MTHPDLDMHDYMTLDELAEATAKRELGARYQLDRRRAIRDAILDMVDVFDGTPVADAIYDIVTAGDVEKPCKACGETMPLWRFPLEKLGKHGRGARCFKCRSEFKRELVTGQRKSQFERDRTPEEAKGLARQRVTRAIKLGQLFVADACEDCGGQPVPAKDGRRTLQAHHHAGYDRALDVKWLCQACHAKAEGPLFRAGSRNGLSKLTEAQVVEIKARLKQREKHRVLAAEYGVSINTIENISRGARWAHVEAYHG